MSVPRFPKACFSNRSKYFSGITSLIAVLPAKSRESYLRNAALRDSYSSSSFRGSSFRSKPCPRLQVCAELCVHAAVAKPPARFRAAQIVFKQRSEEHTSELQSHF